jgi:hypothetical protein
MIPSPPARSRLVTASFIACLLVAACAPSSGAESQSGGTATQAAQLVTRWTIIVSERFERSRAFKSDSVDELVDQFMSIGAVRAAREKAPEEALKRADETIDRFAMAIIKAGERRDDGSTEVTEGAFYAGRQSMCPVYPFC